MPVRVQLSRRKGWRMPADTVKVDRTTRYGNFFVMAHEGTRDRAIADFREKAEGELKYNPRFYVPLIGKNLACWCSLDRACHADVLLEIVNREYPAASGTAREAPGGSVSVDPVRIQDGAALSDGATA